MQLNQSKSEKDIKSSVICSGWFIPILILPLGCYHIVHYHDLQLGLWAYSLARDIFKHKWRAALYPPLARLSSPALFPSPFQVFYCQLSQAIHIIWVKHSISPSYLAFFSHEHENSSSVTSAKHRAHRSGSVESPQSLPKYLCSAAASLVSQNCFGGTWVWCLHSSSHSWALTHTQGSSDSCLPITQPGKHSWAGNFKDLRLLNQLLGLMGNSLHIQKRDLQRTSLATHRWSTILETVCKTRYSEHRAQEKHLRRG